MINIIGGFRTQGKSGYFLKEVISVHWCFRKPRRNKYYQVT